MEVNEGPPMEERDFPEGSSLTREEHEAENKDFLEFLDENKYGLNKRDYLDFVDNIRELRNNEYMQEKSDKYTYLPITQSIRFKTIEILKKMREESYIDLENIYRENDIEKEKIDNNRDKYVRYESENKDVRIFIDMSKTIEELEKEIFSENSMQAMYIFADHEEEPRSKKLREKLVEFFKDRRNTYLFFTGGVVILALSSVVIIIEEGLRKLKNGVEKKMYKKYLEVKDEIKNEVKNEVGKTKEEVKGEVGKTKEEVKGEIGKTRDEVKGDIEKTKDEVKDSIKDEIGKTRKEIKNLIKDEVKNKSSEIKKDISISKKKVEYTLLSLLNDILYKILEYLFVILIFCLVAYFLYYKYG